MVVIVTPHWKLDYIFECLKDNQNVENFKKINLFPRGLQTAAKGRFCRANRDRPKHFYYGFTTIEER